MLKQKVALLGVLVALSGFAPLEAQLSGPTFTPSTFDGTVFRASGGEVQIQLRGFGGGWVGPITDGVENPLHLFQATETGGVESRILDWVYRNSAFEAALFGAPIDVGAPLFAVYSLGSFGSGDALRFGLHSDFGEITSYGVGWLQSEVVEGGFALEMNLYSVPARVEFRLLGVTAIENEGCTINTACRLVPEPSTYALLLSGLGLFGALVLRRRATQV
jgi:hypothetical protein